jgi:hypothetical protein
MNREYHLHPGEGSAEVGAPHALPECTSSRSGSFLLPHRRLGRVAIRIVRSGG